MHMNVFGLQEQIKLFKHNHSRAINSPSASMVALTHNISSSPHFCIHCIWTELYQYTHLHTGTIATTCEEEVAAFTTS